jgi:hypothetical protein
MEEVAQLGASYFVHIPKYYYADQIRRMRWAGHVARVGEERKVYRVFMAQPEGKRSLGRPRRRWEDVIRMDLRETGWKSVEWI